MERFKLAYFINSYAVRLNLYELLAIKPLITCTSRQRVSIEKIKRQSEIYTSIFLIFAKVEYCFIWPPEILI